VSSSIPRVWMVIVDGDDERAETLLSQEHGN
jgi:hypothetical protein